MTTINRAVVEQALEALEDAKALLNNKDRTTTMWFADEITALRAALAQQAEPVGTRALIEECLAAFAQELAAWDIDPPLHHVKQAHDKCEAWLAAPPQQAEPVESALQAVAEKIGDQCAVWYGIGARDVEEVLREAARYGLVHGALAEPVEPVAWYYERDTDKGLSFAPDRDPYKCWQPLTPPRPQRKPLSEEEIERICMTYQSPRQFARAVERAHNITDPQVEDRLARHGIPMPEGNPK